MLIGGTLTRGTRLNCAEQLTKKGEMNSTTSCVGVCMCVGVTIEASFLKEGLLLTVHARAKLLDIFLVKFPLKPLSEKYPE